MSAKEQEVKARRTWSFRMTACMRFAARSMPPVRAAKLASCTEGARCARMHDVSRDDRL